MGASITLAGESLIAQKQASQTALKVSRFIFANVPGLDPSGPVNRAAAKPAAANIVYTYPLPDANGGFVNPNQVVYSAQIGSDIGDWDFNWIGLETAENVLLAVAYVPVQQKRKNIPPLQIGNNLTRNFLVAFDGAQALTGLTIDAKTWQHDFTVRLAGIDERERQSNRDIFGRACFFGSALQLEKVGSAYQVKPGTAYIEGIRLVRSAVLAVVPPALPTTAWIDITLQRELSDVVTSWSVVFAANKPDYTDSAGAKHYCVAIADITAAGITDRRPAEPITGALVQQFAWRTGDYEGLRARATTKQDVGLGNLPNAKSDSLTESSSDVLATSKAVADIWNTICVNITAVATDKALTRADRGLVVVNASGAGTLITLPASDGALGVVDFIIRREDNTGNRLMVQANGDNRIKFHTHLNAAGYPFLVLMGAGDFWHLRSDGKGNWWPVSRHDSDALGRPVFETTTLFSPGGWGAFNGSLLNRSQWPWLWDHAQQSGMLTTEAARVGREGGWTSGDGSLSFRGPEGRGEFLRLLDESRGLDPSRIGGSSQTSSNLSHNHSDSSSYGESATGGTLLSTSIYAKTYYASGGRQYTLSSLPGGNATGLSSLASGGSEARPHNIAYPGRIKLI